MNQMEANSRGMLKNLSGKVVKIQKSQTEFIANIDEKMDKILNYVNDFNSKIDYWLQVVVCNDCTPLLIIINETYLNRNKLLHLM